MSQPTQISPYTRGSRPAPDAGDARRPFPVQRSVRVRAAVGALAVTLAGMGIQIASGVSYGPVPPGVLILATIAVLLATVRWLVVRVAAVIVPAFVLLGVFVSTNGRTDLSHPGHVGAFAGGVVQLAGLVVAVLAGVSCVAEWRTDRRRARSTS
jgi:hypothetical protein